MAQHTNRSGKHYDDSTATKEGDGQMSAKYNSSRGIVSGILPIQTSKEKFKKAMVLACWFPFRFLAAQGLNINIQWVVLKDLKWQKIIRKVCPGIQIIQISEVGQQFVTQMSVDIILVSACSLQDVALIQEKSHAKLFCLTLE